MIRKGVAYLNRKEHPLPTERSLIRILKEDTDGWHEHVCEWKPHHPSMWPHARPKPAEGYLGTAKVIGKWEGIGFHAWEQNDSEFVYYELFHETKPNPEYE